MSTRGKVDFTARLRHYADHLAPVWRALPAAQRGAFLVPASLEQHARDLGVTPTVYGARPSWDRHGPIVVASTQDYRRAVPARRPIVFMQHGVGQGFSGAHNGYSGGRGREGVALFLSPNEYNAALWRAAYPATPAVVVGCPKLDRWLASAPPPAGDPPVVAVSWHWDAQARGNRVPETWTAWRHYRRALPALAQRFAVIGHAHPRIAHSLQGAYRKLGIPFFADFEHILARADIYVNDCSSTLYEFAATGRPVVVCNIPEYRRHINHGLRFWEYADVGVQVNDARHLLRGVEAALTDAPAVVKRRTEITRLVYPYADASRRAVEAILALVSN